MEKYKLIIISIMVSFTFIFCSCAQIAENEGKLISINHLPLFGHDSNIDSISGFDNVNFKYDKAMVYNVLPYEFSEEKSKQLGNSFANGELVRAESHLNTYIMDYKDGSIIEVGKITGTFQYFTQKYIDMSYEDEIIKRLSGQEYIERSVKFIKDENIAFDTLDLSNAAVAPYMTVESVDENGLETEKVRLMGVYFHNKPIDNVEFWGVGPRFVLVFDNSGEVVNVHTAWREFTPYKEYTLVGAKEIEERVALDQYACNKEAPGSLTITEIKLVYITDPLGYKQEYLVPAYKLICTDSSKDEVEVYVQALKDGDFVEQQIYEYPIDSSNSEKAKQEYMEEPFDDAPKSIDPDIEQKGALGLIE